MIAAWPGCLTRREAECAELICRGLARPEVIAAMGISYKTYDTYRGKALRKLGLRNEVQLLWYALARSLVEPPEPVVADPVTGEPIGAAA